MDVGLDHIPGIASGVADSSSAANNGISDRMFKWHGRWRSENSKNEYVEDSLESRLAVSISLGL